MTLQVRDLHVAYGKLEVLHGIDIEVPAGRCTGIVGANGAGKTTLLNAIAGVLSPRAGSIWFNGDEITGRRPHDVAAAGLVLVPEGRQLFPRMSALDNLRVAERCGSARETTFTSTDAFDLFPSLAARADIAAGRLSGGEQQMLAIARALMLAPSLIMLDEPSIGLAPKVVTNVMEVVNQLSRRTGVLLVEQNLAEVRRIADRAYVLSHGRIAGEGPAEIVVNEASLRKEYLGA